MFKSILAVIQRDLTLAMRRKTDSLTPLFFFIIVLSLFPLSIGIEEAVLKTIAPGAIWIAVLLASMLSLQRLFADDFADGTLEQMLLTPHSLSLLVLGRVFAHWLVSGLPLIIITPLIALQYHLPVESLVIMIQALLIGTPILSLIGAIGSALTLGVRGGGIILTVLILPLFIPILIYGAGAITASFDATTDSTPFLLLLGTFLLLSIALAPIAAATALKITLE